MWVLTLVQEDPQRRKWQPIPWTENSMDRGARWVHSPWDRKESDMTEHTAYKLGIAITLGQCPE